MPKSNSSVSRRNFLKTGAISSAGIVASSIETVPAQMPSSKVISIEQVIADKTLDLSPANSPVFWGIMFDILLHLSRFWL